MGLQLIVCPVLLQEGIVRAKLAKTLSGYEDVRYEQSVVTRANIKEVSSRIT